MNFNKNVKQVSCVKVSNLMVSCQHYFAYLIQFKNLTLKNFLLYLLVFFDRSNIFEPNQHFPRNSNHHWKCREEKEGFEATLVIISWNFTIFQYRSDSPQVKGNLISSITNLLYELPHELPNDLRLRKLGNIRKISNLGGHIAQYLVSLQELRICEQQLKNTQKQIPNLFFLSSFTGLIHFVPNILSGIVARNQIHLHWCH